MAKPTLTLVIPTYKKERIIVSDLKRIANVVKKLKYTTEVICVVDGMIDRTYEKAQGVAKKIKFIKVIGYPTNKGKGYAVRYGMAHSKGSIVAFIDSGKDINPSSLSMILEHFKWYEADIIVGSKRHPVSKINWTLKRRLFSLSYQIVNRVLFGLKVKDTQVGLKCYRRHVLLAVLPRLRVKRYAFDVEILAIANYLGFKKMYEAPVEVNFLMDKSTSAASVRHISRMLWDTLAVFYRLKIVNYYSDSNKHAWYTDPLLKIQK